MTGRFQSIPTRSLHVFLPENLCPFLHFAVKVPDRSVVVGSKTFVRYPDMVPSSDYLATCARMDALPIKIESHDEKLAVVEVATDQYKAIFGEQ